jgi:hypothetical protein
MGSENFFVVIKPILWRQVSLGNEEHSGGFPLDGNAQATPLASVDWI